MLKLYYNKEIYNKLNSSGYEFNFCCHLMNHKNFNQPRFKPVLDYGEKYIIYSNPEQADYHLMPYKWSNDNIYNNQVIEEAKKYNKKLIISYIDDTQPNINIDNSIILKGNIDEDKIKENEICIPVYPNSEFYDFSLLENNKSIGFCGQSDKPTLRKEVCELLKKENFTTNFIYRDRFHWFYDEKFLRGMREEYNNVLRNNLFSLAIRGVGNFSYRLCEIIHFGRIPIIIKTNNCLPLENIIDWNKCSIICDEKELNLLSSKIEEFIKNNDLSEIQINNRKIWEEYLSPLGFTKNLKNILKNE